MATIHLAVLKQRQKSNGHFTIYIVVTHKRDVRYITTAYEVDDLFQFENGKVVCRKDTKIMNQRLQYTIVEYQEKINAIRDVDVYSCSQIKDLLEGKIEEEHKIEKCISIKEYLEMWIKNFRKSGHTGYADMNENTLEKILSIVGDVSWRVFLPRQ